MFRIPRRMATEKMASKQMNSQSTMNRRMVISMPDLQDIKLPEVPPRNSSFRRVETDIGKGRRCQTSAFLSSLSVTSFNDFHRNRVRCWKEMVSWVTLSLCLYIYVLYYIYEYAN